jgi:6-pyruvoyltetrahydropterin/6-carboxytetrahydropterin synthase
VLQKRRCGAFGTGVKSSPAKAGIYNRKWQFESQDQQGERMYEVTVEDSFAAGHYLRNYKGKCENPHGHNYKVRVTLRGEALDKAGLLLDFKDLKEVMKNVIDRLDHQMLNEIAPFTELNPSAENLAKYFFDQTNSRLQSLTTGRVTVKDVTIWETDVTTARYSA